MKLKAMLDTISINLIETKYVVKKLETEGQELKLININNIAEYANENIELMSIDSKNIINIII